MAINRSWWRIGILAAVGALSLFLVLAQGHSTANIIALAIALVLLVAQTRWPVRAGLAQIALGMVVALLPGFDSSLFFLLLVTLLDLNQHRPAWVGYLATAGAAVATVTGILTQGESASGAVVIPALLVGAAGIGVLLRARADSARQQAELNELRMLAQRQGISREIHDVVAYGLSQIVLRARLAAADEGVPAATAAQLREIAETGRQSLAEVRSVIAILDRGSEDAPPPAWATAEGLEEGLERIRADLRASGFDADVAFEGDVSALSLASLYLAAQVTRELAANTLRHADRSQPVTIRVSNTGENVLALSRNRTATADAEAFPSSGRGLGGLRKRVESYGGSLTAGEENGIWTTTVVLPTKASL